jgi:hypothetical protein
VNCPSQRGKYPKQNDRDENAKAVAEDVRERTEKGYVDRVAKSLDAAPTRVISRAVRTLGSLGEEPVES